MTVRNVLAHEGALLNILGKLAPLAWGRFQRRFPEIWVVDHAEVHDHSSYPPRISFRFENEVDGIIEQLKLAVVGYSGEVRWVLTCRNREGLPGIIWSIVPEEVLLKEQSSDGELLSVNEYFSKNFPFFGLIAYRDLGGLTEHIEQYFFSGSTGAVAHQG
ncbi:hypothetical protein [Achromobacter insuavis]|uniref:hypothetical protein n=1 Tax=Achromobacter insuavis TaxID=1287735 RepID=UPI0013C306BF|nr:hypothetical protein [Achromobacter insuavis]